MSDAYQKLEKLIDFPSTIDFRIIVVASVADALLQIENVCNSIENNSVKKSTVPARKSRNGQYSSYTVPVTIKSPAHLQAVYEKVGALDCVKHII